MDLLEAARTATGLARDLNISTQTIYIWRRQDRIDRGLEPSLTSDEKAELATAERRIAELEADFQANRRAIELVREVVPKRRFEAIAVTAGEGTPVEVACRVLAISVSGYYGLARSAAGGVVDGWVDGHQGLLGW